MKLAARVGAEPAGTDLDAAARALAGEVGRSKDGRLVVEARAPLPTREGPFDVRLFRFQGDEAEHLAISLGDLASAAPVAVRVHSECFTGEVLQSERCDCAGQLSFALRRIQSLGRGLVIYLRQEGRGIGLANKLRAYALQSLGADTVDANRLLGLPDDARDYAAAAALLEYLEVQQVQLMTNNPAKVSALEALGVKVVARLPVIVGGTTLARQYLQTKRERMNHLIPNALPVDDESR